MYSFSHLATILPINTVFCDATITFPLPLSSETLFPLPRSRVRSRNKKNPARPLRIRDFTVSPLLFHQYQYVTGRMCSAFPISPTTWSPAKTCSTLWTTPTTGTGAYYRFLLPDAKGPYVDIKDVACAPVTQNRFACQFSFSPATCPTGCTAVSTGEASGITTEHCCPL
jgi:hypothetical protein